MSNYDDPERRFSCFSEPTQVLRRHPHSLSLKGLKSAKLYCMLVIFDPVND